MWSLYTLRMFLVHFCMLLRAWMALRFALEVLTPIRLLNYAAVGWAVVGGPRVWSGCKSRWSLRSCSKLFVFFPFFLGSFLGVPIVSNISGWGRFLVWASTLDSKNCQNSDKEQKKRLNISKYHIFVCLLGHARRFCPLVSRTSIFLRPEGICPLYGYNAMGWYGLLVVLEGVWERSWPCFLVLGL